ncbi:MAG TPA: AAA family ATPase [Candidatus Corynebacterium gallistercoris]|uniref:gluconokinase n=1 Tax=Candidatus Corynebacterium gallistercoris TaxID=2838530 RepID=A0A9D1URC2_9CORY|nr:AAA family ATPase [Candidatus Corynebacterium gallistercoris]
MDHAAHAAHAAEQPQATVHIVVMGVSGTGKTTLARRIAEHTGWALQEADDLHPASTMEILKDGKLPDNAVRKEWLGRVRDWIAAEAAAGRNSVTACTSLRREHREILNGAAHATVFYVHLYGTEDVLAERMAHRIGTDLPRELLTTQLNDLQRLQADERGVQLDVSRSPDELLDDALNAAMFAQRAYREEG